MSNELLVFAEHQGGKITRPTWESLAAGQHLAQDLDLKASVVILGEKVSGLADELAAADLNEVLAVDSHPLAEYTADGYTEALRALVNERKPRFVVFNHTYQVRDFAPKLAAALDRGCLARRPRPVARLEARLPASRRVVGGTKTPAATGLQRPL